MSILRRGIALTLSLSLAWASPSVAQSVQAEGGVTIQHARHDGDPGRLDSERIELGPRPFIGEHTITATQPGQSRLSFVLHRLDREKVDATWLDSVSRRSFVDEFLIDHLAERSGGSLHDMTVTDRIVVRSSDNRHTAESEHALEFEGPDAAVRDALGYLQRFITANRGTITLKLTCATHPVAKSEFESGAADGSPLVALLDAAARDRMTASLMQIPDIDVLQAPTITVYGGQRGMIQMINQVSYIADYEIEAVLDTIIADPIVKVFNDGLSWSVTAILEPDSGNVFIETNAKLTALRRPMRTFETKLLADVEPVSFHLPEWDQAEWSTRRIALSKNERAIHVSGLRFSKRVADEDPEIHELVLLIALEDVKPDAAQGAAALGMVIGVDGSTGKVFVRSFDQTGNATQISAERLRIYRDDKAVGECTVVENLNGVLVLRLEKGEARAGDTAR
jgi:hypothetical protein